MKLEEEEEFKFSELLITPALCMLFPLLISTLLLTPQLMLLNLTREI